MITYRVDAVYGEHASLRHVGDFEAESAEDARAIAIFHGKPFPAGTLLYACPWSGQKNIEESSPEL